MQYSIYKLEFQTGVHFGTGMLNESAYTFQADQLFSALYIEALKMNCEKELFDCVKNGKLLFSDAFPYFGQQYMIPKPMLYVEPKVKGISEQKKKYKKIQFIPVEQLEDFLDGTTDLDGEIFKGYGTYMQQSMVNVRNNEETLPYRVGTFYFSENCGLYIIVAYESESEKTLAENLLEGLSYTGIGGKKSVGLGKFNLLRGKMSKCMQEHLERDSNKKILLSVALPRDEELECALNGASYQLSKRSGFVASSDYADEWRKKKELFVSVSGSCFEQLFEGDVYDVSNGGSHPVYRYAKSLFMGV